MALKYIEDIDLDMDTKRFREVGEYVMARRRPPDPGVEVGHRHEHVRARERHPRRRRHQEPEDLRGLLARGGRSGAPDRRRQALGRARRSSSSSTSTASSCRKEEAAELLPRVRTMAIELKRALFDKELLYIYKDLQAEKKKAGEGRAAARIDRGAAAERAAHEEGE